MDVSVPMSPADQEIALPGGISAGSVSRPASAVEVADLLRAASDLDQGVVPFGGGLSLAAGNVIEPVDIGLDLTGLRGVYSYHPADLTLSVGAGTTFAEIAGTLREHGQELPIDVPFPDRATIGGLIATGFAGPRRLSAGSLKDLIIGCEFARGDGLLAKAGGMVVKNVSGFEIPRLLHGSWGSLAVLTSVNLKVVPGQRSEATLLVRVASVATAVDMASRLLAAQPAVSACTVTRRDDDVTMAVRYMGRHGAVLAMVKEGGASAAAYGTIARTLEEPESRTFWQTQVETWASESIDVVISAGTRPRDLSRFVSIVEDRFGGPDHTFSLVSSPGTGAIRFRLDRTAIAAEELRAWWTEAEFPARTVGHVEFAPTDWKRGTSVWGLGQAQDPLMRAIKTQFDPHGILNPGRLFV